MRKFKDPNKIVDNRLLRVRVSDVLLEKVINDSKKAGINRSQYVRQTLWKKEIRCRSDKEMIAQVRKIGININQIARIINSEKKIKDIEKLKIYLEEFSNSLNEIISKIDAN